MKSNDAIDPVVARIAERTYRNRYRSAKGEPFGGPFSDVWLIDTRIMAGAFIVWLLSSAIIAVNTVINEAWRQLWGKPKYESKPTHAWPAELKLMWVIALTAFAAYGYVLWDKWGS